MDAPTAADNITEDEAELYDRQIRLWGLDAQRRLRGATVLLIGLKGLGAEVAKNIILAGVKEVTFMDPCSIDEEDKMSQFFISNHPVGGNRAEASAPSAQLLNPMVTVKSVTQDPEKMGDDFYLGYDVICATCCPLPFQCRLDHLCFQNNIKFFSGNVFGYYGYFFADLGTHEYLYEQPKVKKQSQEGEADETEEETVAEKQTMTFTRLTDELNVTWADDTPEMKRKLRRTPNAYFILRVYEEFVKGQSRRPSTKSLESDCKELQNLRIQILNQLRAPAKVIPDDFYEYGFGELSPVCAIVGGVLGQEIIKAVSQKDAPHNNFFFYNGLTDNGIVDKFTSGTG